MAELPKDLAARISGRPVPVAEQLESLKADLEAPTLEERQAARLFGKPTVPTQQKPLGLPPLKPVAKRPSTIPTRPVLAANPVVVNPDAEEQRVMPGRGRNPYILNFMNEWLVVTCHTLAMRCSRQANGRILDADQLLALAESIRKSNMDKMAKGTHPLVVKVPDAPSRTAYRQSAFGSSFVTTKFPTGTESDEQRLSNTTYDIREALVLSTIAAELSVPSEPGSWGEGNEGLEPALPLISRYRIHASRTEEFKSPAYALEAQRNGLNKWCSIPEERGGLPVVGTNWDLSLMDDEMHAKVHKAMLKPIPGKRSRDGVGGEPIIWPASLFETYDPKGRPEGLIDGVIGAPWIIERDPRTGQVFHNTGFSAIISDLHGQTKERIRYVLQQVYRSFDNETSVFRNLYVFVPGAPVGVSWEAVWEDLRKTTNLRDADKDWLHVVLWEPLNSGREEYTDAIAPALSRGEKKQHGAG